MEHNKEISSLHFLFPYPILISTCTEGYACFWGVKPCPLDYRFKLLKKVRNNLTEPEIYFSKMGITKAKTKFVEFEVNNGLEKIPLMTIGDESGYIHFWNLNVFVKEIVSLGFKELKDSIAKSKPSFNPKKNAYLD